MHADYLTELERNGRKFDAALADLKATMDRRDVEASKRETRLLLAMAVLLVLAVAALRWLDADQAPPPSVHVYPQISTAVPQISGS